MGRTMPRLSAQKKREGAKPSLIPDIFLAPEDAGAD
jgi:hypothetical protein